MIREIKNSVSNRRSHTLDILHITECGTPLQKATTTNQERQRQQRQQQQQQQQQKQQQQQQQQQPTTRTVEEWV